MFSWTQFKNQMRKVATLQELCVASLFKGYTLERAMAEIEDKGLQCLYDNERVVFKLLDTTIHESCSYETFKSRCDVSIAELKQFCQDLSDGVSSNFCFSHDKTLRIQYPEAYEVRGPRPKDENLYAVHIWLAPNFDLQRKPLILSLSDVNLDRRAIFKYIMYEILDIALQADLIPEDLKSKPRGLQLGPMLEILFETSYVASYWKPGDTEAELIKCMPIPSDKTKYSMLWRTLNKFLKLTSTSGHETRFFQIDKQKTKEDENSNLLQIQIRALKPKTQSNLIKKWRVEDVAQMNRADLCGDKRFLVALSQSLERFESWSYHISHDGTTFGPPGRLHGSDVLIEGPKPSETTWLCYIVEMEEEGGEVTLSEEYRVTSSRPSIEDILDLYGVIWMRHVSRNLEYHGSLNDCKIIITTPQQVHIIWSGDELNAAIESLFSGRKNHDPVEFQVSYETNRTVLIHTKIMIAKHI